MGSWSLALPSCGCTADKVKDICRENVFVMIKVVTDPIHNLLEDNKLRETSDAPAIYRKAVSAWIMGAQVRSSSLPKANKQSGLSSMCLNLLSSAHAVCKDCERGRK